MKPAPPVTSMLWLAFEIMQGLHLFVLVLHELPCAQPHAASSARGSALRRNLLIKFLELLGAVLRRMAAQHALACRFCDAAPPFLAQLRKKLHDVARTVGDQYFFTRFEETSNPRPTIGDQGHAAGCRFEQPHARRKPRADHIGTSDAERKSLPAIEIGMRVRRQMFEAIDIAWPGHDLGILRARDNKAVPWQYACSLE